jgi:hypothetical protein
MDTKTSLYRAKQVLSWRDRDDLDDMIPLGEEYLYDSPDPDLREPITRQALEDLEMLDENGDERRVFDGYGFAVPRRIPRFHRSTLPLAGLVDFEYFHQMFGSSNEDDDGDNDVQTPFSVYPQAGLLTCGHVTAKGLMFPYRTCLASINELLRRTPNDPDENRMDEGQDHEEWGAPNHPAVVGIACQLYNSLMHNTRGNSTQHHGVVLGNITAALAGHWAKGTPENRKAEAFARKCDNRLPHEEYLQKITDRPVSRDLRIENVLTISMSAIHPDKRNGR